MAPPNNTRPLYPKMPRSSVVVEMGPVLDGVAEHMRDYPPEQSFVVAERRPGDVTEVLRRSGAEILINYLPVGSQQATEHYARACLEAGRVLHQLHPRVHRVGSAVGGRVRAAWHPRGRATTSSRRSARRSSIACWRSCSPIAASPSTAPIS